MISKKILLRAISVCTIISSIMICHDMTIANAPSQGVHEKKKVGTVVLPRQIKMVGISKQGSAKSSITNRVGKKETNKRLFLHESSTSSGPLIKSIRSSNHEKVLKNYANLTPITKSFIDKKDTTPYIRVLLSEQCQQIAVMSRDRIVVGNGKDTTVDTFLPAMVSVPIMVKNNNIVVDKKVYGPMITVRSISANEAISIDGQDYRGSIFFIATGPNSMTMINHVPLEEYLYGVVPQEAIPSWPMSALEAQAVAARTYAIYTMNNNKNKLYDIRPTTKNQVYGGKSGEYTNTTRAVDATRGVIIRYNGRPINALFHSDSGGYTENSENVWGTNLPYLQGVKDENQSAPTATWLVSISKKQLEEKLYHAGKSVGTLHSIQLSPLVAPPIYTIDRGVSGRIKSAVFIGSKGHITISGDTLMAILGLKSTLFDFYINHKPTTMAWDRKQEKIYHTFTKNNDMIYIKGHGCGHGVGLSQWGAAEMAKRATHEDTNFYKTILRHYYTGVSIDTIY